MSLKIAWIIYGPLSQATGGYVYDRMIVEGLRARSICVEVISMIPNQPASLEAAADQLDALEPDVLVGDALCAPELGTLFELWAARACRLLLVHHLASWEFELEPRDRAARVNVEQRALAACDQVVTTSFATAARLTNQYPICDPEVIVPGADRLRRIIRRKRSPHVILLGVGSVIARKRWEILLEALDHLALEHVYLRLIGDESRDPDYCRAIKARIAHSPYLSTHVDCLGLVDMDRLADEFSNADALILPSSLEGYGMVITEALQAGLAVIAARQPAISEAMANHAEATLQFGDVAQLRQQLLHFATEPQLRGALQHAAARLSVALPTWRDAEERFYDLLQRAAALARTNSVNCSSDEPSRISSAARHGSAKRTVASTSR